MACQIDDEAILSPTVSSAQAFELGQLMGSTSVLAEVRGQIQVLAAFVEGYQTTHPKVSGKWKRKSLIYELESLQTPTNVLGDFQVPAIATEELLEWSKAYCTEAGIPLDHSDRIIRRGIQRESLHTWEVNGIAVGFAGYASPVVLHSHRTIRITSVFTGNIFRSKGYASALVSAMCKKLLAEQPTRVILNVASDNEAAIRAYERIGFKLASSTATLAMD